MTAGPSGTFSVYEQAFSRSSTFVSFKKLTYTYGVRGAASDGAPNITGMSETLHGDGTRTLNLTGHSFGRTASSVLVGSSPVPERNIRCNVITWTEHTVVCAVSPLTAGE